MLDSVNVENKFQEVNCNFSLAKIEQLDVDASHALRKDRKHVESKIIRIEKSPEKRKLRSIIVFLRLILSEKKVKTWRNAKYKSDLS